MFSTTSRESISTTLSPDQDELRRVFRVVASELNIAQVDNRLLLAVAKNIAKTVNLVIRFYLRLFLKKNPNEGLAFSDVQQIRINASF